MKKEIINLSRRRKLPEGFGWVDHRLARERHIERFSPDALALYLFLVTVGDGDGVSWYSEEVLRGRLNFSSSTLNSARKELLVGGLAAYRSPYYQVLEVPRPVAGETAFREALRAALHGTAPEGERRQPLGTEGKGVLPLSLPGYRRPEGSCDVLKIGTVLEAMAGGVR